MQFIDDFFHHHWFFYSDKNQRNSIPDRHYRFAISFLSLLQYKGYTSDEKLPLLLDKKFCEETWLLPVPFLIEEEKVDALDDFWRETHSDYPQKIGNKRYYMYCLWSKNQLLKSNRWYIDTFFGSEKEYIASRARALSAHSYKPIEPEDEE